MQFIKNFILEEEGPTVVEYAVMLAAILMTILGTISLLGSASSGMWSNNNTELQNHGF
jgi:pilus assembly protein Flp/PilA